MNAEFVNAEFIASCDERINSIQEHGKLLRTPDFSIEPKYQNVINRNENSMKLVQVEKMIYKAVANKNTPRQLFSKLLSKYDDLLRISYDLSNNMVIDGLMTEGNYLEFCKNSLDQREYIKDACLYGETLVSMLEPKTFNNFNPDTQARILRSLSGL